MTYHARQHAMRDNFGEPVKEKNMKHSEEDHTNGCTERCSEPTTSTMRIGASMLVGFIRHAYEEVRGGLVDGSRSVTRGRVAAVKAAREVCVGLSDMQIFNIATGHASLLGYHTTGFYYVEDPMVNYDPAVHTNGPVRLVESSSKKETR